MNNLSEIFKKDYSRVIETVIKADDKQHIFQEVDEYVITKHVSLKLADFFEVYNDKTKTNGVWISGFFGSGKSHLLKILSYVLENKHLNGTFLGELFADKIKDDPKLKADILNAIRKFNSESILFNIDQQAQITAKTDSNAVLQVFYKVFYDHLGFFGFQPHIADFEMHLAKEGNYEKFKAEFQKHFSKPWSESRMDYVDPRISDAIAKACATIYGHSEDKYEDYLDKWDNKQRFSIEDFALKVNEYISTKGNDFRLNFFVDEVGQYVAENTKLMLNLQTIAETLFTKCGGKSWIIVTSQEDLESLVGDDSVVQTNDFSKIQGRFSVRMPLTSANVDEVIEKRLLEKNDQGVSILEPMYAKEGENMKTLLTFSEIGMQFKGFQGAKDFVKKFPFIPYQFDLFQQCIKSLSTHSVFQGKHQSVGERSMIGVFQEVLKKADLKSTDRLVSFDLMFEGIRSTLRSETQNSIFLAERQLSENTLAVRALKVLFMIKYYDNFKATSRNISILLLDSIRINPAEHHEKVEIALNVLENQTYIQRKGEEYEYLSNDEKDIENEIKNTQIEQMQITQLMSELFFDEIIKDSKIKYQLNKQEFEFTRRVDGTLFGREKELKIELVSMDFSQYEFDGYFSGSTMGDSSLMILKLPEEKRLLTELRQLIKTDKYIKQNQSASNSDSKTRILIEKGQDNRERRKLLINTLNRLIAEAKIYIGGTVYQSTNSSDGKMKVFDAAQRLIQLAFPKLELLGSANYDEAQLRLIMSRNGADLFGNEESAVSAAEQEMLNLIVRKQKQIDRLGLNDLKEHFSKKPYGWSQLAIWSVLARLFKRGKLEVRQDTNILDDNAFLEALLNNRQWINTLILPQVEFDKNQINKLKAIYQDAFNESNPYSDAKEAANAFKQKAREEEAAIRIILAQAQIYPFVNRLDPLAELLKELSRMDYSKLILTIHEYEDRLLDDKENILDSVKQFFAGGQKLILDSVKSFLIENQYNFEYVDAIREKEVLTNFLEDEVPYQGNKTRDSKDTMELVRKKITVKIEQERNINIERIDSSIEQLKVQEAFAKLSQQQQQSLLKPFVDLIENTKQHNNIASLLQYRNSLGKLLTDQLNQLHQLINGNKAEDDNGNTAAPLAHFVNIKVVEKQINFEKQTLSSEADVNSYVEKIRKALLKEIEQNKKITLH